MSMMASFVDFARAHGVLVRSLAPSDRIRRCPTVDHRHSQNGAYFWDGARGWVMRWDGDAELHWYQDDSRQWTPAERADWQRQRVKAEQTRAQQAARAARQAEDMLAGAEMSAHNYLARKGFPAALGHVDADGRLLVPMRDAETSALRGVQVISWDMDARAWQKKMLFGMRARGAVLRLGRRDATERIYCEGYATGLSIEAAVLQMRLPIQVVVCFSASNLVHVAQAAAGRGMVFADHDGSGTGEAAAKQTGLPYCMSECLGEDANDLHMRAGLWAVCGQIQKARLGG